MKEYMITSEVNENLTETVTIHRNVTADAYIAIYSGNRQEVAEYLKEHNITDYGIGF